jgi:hypothetical protein
LQSILNAIEDLNVDFLQHAGDTTFGKAGKPGCRMDAPGQVVKYS